MEAIFDRINRKISGLSTAGRQELLKNILNLLDLTTLEGTDNDTRIRQLCDKALRYMDKGLPAPAAVCVYPPFVKLAKSLLAASGIKVASAAGAFPSGQLPLHLRLNEVQFALDEGADEIDMVISRGAFLAGDYEALRNEVSAMKRLCAYRHLKVILETGELISADKIKLASELAIASGADFIKTSTGKIQPAATPEAMAVMLLVIKNHFEKTGIRIGIKPAGGISTPDQALFYYLMVEELAGNEWLDSSLFRIGASRLADAIATEVLTV